MIKNDSEFLKFAFQNYDNRFISFLSDFEFDIKRFTYLNILLNRYRQDRLDLKDRLILNHIVILGNCFSVQCLLEMLEYKIQTENKNVLDVFLYYLGYIKFPKNFEDKYLLDLLNAN